MPTGNGGISQGLSLRLTNMEQGRREVTANQMNRERLDMAKAQQKAAADYRRAAAEQKQLQNQQRQLDAITKDINLASKTLDPIYNDPTLKDVAGFVQRTVQGINDPKTPNYTSSAQYMNDKAGVIARLGLREASSKNIAAGMKQVHEHPEDYELRTDIMKAYEDNLNYESFIKANGGTDYVMPGGIVQPKFNRAKVMAAMWDYATKDEKPVMEPSNVSGVAILVPKVNANGAKLEEMRNAYLQSIAGSGMNNDDFQTQAKGIVDVYNEIKGKAKYGDPKTFNRTWKPDKVKEAEDGTVKLTSSANGKKTYTNKNVQVGDSQEINGNLLTYKSLAQGTTPPKYGLPKGSVDEDSNAVEGFIVDPQYHINKEGEFVLVGALTDNAGNVTNAKAKITIPMNGKDGNIIGQDIFNQTKQTIQISFNEDTKKYEYKINVGGDTKAKEMDNTTPPKVETPKATTPKGTTNKSAPKKQGLAPMPRLKK